MRQAVYTPVTPVDVLLEFNTLGILPTTLLLLAHEVVESPEKFQLLLRNYQGNIILDNSLIELGKPAEPDVMIEAVRITNPTFVVLPDKLMDKQFTIDAADEALRTWGRGLKRGVMIAAQGESVDECVECAVQLHGMVKPTGLHLMIGIPRIMANKFGSRLPLVQALSRMGLRIHLLGMSENFYDDISCAAMPNVTSIDSATPMRMGYQGLSYGDGYVHNEIMSKLIDRDLWFEICNEVRPMMSYNLAYVQGMIDKATAIFNGKTAFSGAIK